MEKCLLGTPYYYIPLKKRIREIQTIYSDFYKSTYRLLLEDMTKLTISVMRNKLNTEIFLYEIRA